MGISGQLLSSATLIPKEELPVNRKLGGPQSWNECGVKGNVSAAIESDAAHPACT